MISIDGNSLIGSSKIKAIDLIENSYAKNFIKLNILRYEINSIDYSEDYNMLFKPTWKYFISNAIGLFVFRLPEIIFQGILVFHHSTKQTVNTFRFCYNLQLREDSICLNLIDSANFFSIISMCINFILLILYCDSFRKAFLNLF